MSKPFKGVIRSWNLVNSRIMGICVAHTTYENGITDDEPITISEVVAIFDKGTYRLCVTKNSRYILI